jgi:protein-S-isoprenylcysteine O-methyltransferase Ste14
MNPSFGQWISGWQWISAALLLACLACFGWAMRKFFVQPAGLTPGMKLIKMCGVAFGLLHLAAILATPGITYVGGVIGAALYISSLGLFWWAIRSSLRQPLSAAFSPDLPAHLVAHGPYRLIRHPLYCSYLMCWLAGWVVTGRWWLAPTVVAMLVIYLKAAAVEEKKFMRSSLAEAYRQYRAHTGMLFPNPWKLFAGGRKTSPERDPWETAV